MPQNEHRTVDRVVDILEYLAANKEGVSFSEISRALSMPKSSLHPVIHTLCRRRLLHYRDDVQKYVLGDLTFSLGSSYVADSSLLNKMDELLAELTLKTNETCHFGVLAGNEVLYLLKQSPSSPVHVAARSGYRLQAHCSAIGKALLSQFDREELMGLFPGGLKALTENTITDFDALCRQLEEIRATGFGYENEESSRHVQCLSTPLACRGKIVAAVSVAFPVFYSRQNTDKADRIKEHLVEIRKKMESLIAGNIGEWIYGN